MKKTEELFGKLVVKAGKIVAEGDLNVNSPWFYNQPLEPETMREKRRDKVDRSLPENDA